MYGLNDEYSDFADFTSGGFGSINELYRFDCAKAPFERVMTGTLKTFLGFLVMSQGGTIITGMLNPLNEIMMEAFHIQGVIPVNEAISAIAAEQFGTQMALIAFFGLILNMILARITRFKYIFLSGHHTIFMGALTSVMLSALGLEPVVVVVIGTIIVGVLSVITPAISMPFMRKVTGEIRLLWDIGQQPAMS